MEFPGGGITVGLLGETYANWGIAASVAMSFAFGAVAALVGQWMRAC
jgi:hypothetical protein